MINDENGKKSKMMYMAFQFVTLSRREQVNSRQFNGSAILYRERQRDDDDVLRSLIVIVLLSSNIH